MAIGCVEEQSGNGCAWLSDEVYGINGFKADYYEERTPFPLVEN